MSKLFKIILSAPFINRKISSGFDWFWTITLIDFLSEEYSNDIGIWYFISINSLFFGFFKVILLSFLPRNIYLYFLAKFNIATSSGDDDWYINFLFDINSFSSMIPLWHVIKAVINKSRISFWFISEFFNSSFISFSSSFSSSIKFDFNSSLLSLLLLLLIFSFSWKKLINPKSWIKSSSFSNKTCLIFPYSSIYFSFLLGISFFISSFCFLLIIILSPSFSNSSSFSLLLYCFIPIDTLLNFI